jgi:regulatory protein
MAYATIRRGASQDGYFAVPVEGSSFFISPGQLTHFSLHEGQELTEAEFETLRQRLLGMRCRQKAMDLLAMREHGRKELELKLRRKEFPHDTIAEQLDRLEEENLLSDQRFAFQFIVARQRKNPEGRQVLILRLMQRGIDRSIAESAAGQWFSDEEAAHDALHRAAARSLRKKQVDHSSLRAELYKKGFTAAEISVFMEEIG